MNFWLYFFAAIGFFSVISFCMVMILYTIHRQQERNEE